MSTGDKQKLIDGLLVALGMWIFGLYGPWLFQRFGLNVPEAAAVGILVGAAVGDGIAHLFARRAAATVPDAAGPGAVVSSDDRRDGDARGSGGMTGDSEDKATALRIEQALGRLLPDDGADIRVEVRNRKVVLQGCVHGWKDEAEAERIAFDMPGVQQVDNRLEVVQ